MTRILSLLTGVVFALLCVASCSGDGSSDVTVHRLDRQISHGTMPDDSLSQQAVATLFRLSGYPEPTHLTVDDYSLKPSINIHLAAVEAEYADTERESRALGRVFDRLHELLPDARIPEVFTIISPFTQSVILADSMLFIGLNHYLGVDYEPYEYFPAYVRRLKTRDRIPVDVAEALVRITRPFAPADDYPQALSRLAYEGAVAEAVMQLTGCDEATALGYDEDTYGWFTSNEARLWDAIVGQQLLFSTDQSVARSLVDLAPHVSALSPEVPGRAGRFIGHRLVKAYLGNNHIPLATLLTPDFYLSPDLLTLASYNP